MQVLILFVVALSFMHITWADESADDSLHDEHPENIPVSLEGKRLFFEVYQQAPTEAFIGGSQGAIEADETHNSADAVIARPEVPGSTKKQPDVPSYIAIRFDARIQSEEYLWIIINGIPCDRVERSRHLSERLDRTLVCSLSQRSDLQVLLLADGKRVQILRDKAIVDVLSPGQEL